jgi:hypothetical protein
MASSDAEAAPPPYRMTITLVSVSVPPGRGAYNGVLPQRMRWLHPGAAEAYESIKDAVVVSDMYRSAEASLSAMQRKVGVLPPGRSRHGYGLAIDVSVPESMALVGVRSKEAFDDWMGHRDWHCHRLDHAMQSEAWHYNWLRLGLSGIARNERSTNPAGERQLQELYGSMMAPGPRDRQIALARVGLYRGDLDGELGPLSNAAGQAFSRGWMCAKPWTPAMLRVLAFVAADLRTPDGALISPAHGVEE